MSPKKVIYKTTKIIFLRQNTKIWFKNINNKNVVTYITKLLYFNQQTYNVLCTL